MNSKNVMLFAAGLGAGAALALLFAPKSGNETRSQITDAIAGGRERAMQQTSQIRESLRKTADQFTAAVDAGREAYRGAARRVGDEVEEAIDSLSA